MSPNFHSSFFYTEDDYRIFYSTNFKLSEYDPNRALLIFNYGLVCNNEHWRYQIDHFDQQKEQILIHDYRFHYSSSGKIDHLEELTFPLIAGDIKALLTSFKAQNYFMFGHSMGVNVTLEFAKLFPESLKGLILISGTVLPPQDVMFDTNIIEIITPYVESLYEKKPDLYRKFWSTSYLNPLAREIVFRGGFNTKQVSNEFIQIYMKRIGELHPKIFLKLMQEMKTQDILKDLGNIETPTLVIGGDKDKVIPNYLQNILKDKLPNSELYIVKDGSHVPQVDFPTTMNEKIEVFISKNL